MKHLARPILLVATNILFCTVNLAGQTPDASVKIRLVQEFLIVVPVRINDAETLELLLDTGTKTSVIVPEAAARLKLRPVDRVEMVTVAGSVIAPRSFLPRVALGEKSAANVEVLWTELPELRRLDSRISGILGRNFLSQFNFTLDFGKRRISFADTDDNQSGRAARVPFANDEGRMMLTLNIKQTDLTFVLDSGVANLVLFASGCHKLAGHIEPSAQTMRVSTNAGSSVTRTGWLDRLQFGDQGARRVPIVLLNKVERREDGLLPLRLFRSVYINNQEGYMILNPELVH